MPFPDFVDNTTRKAFAVCPTKAKYEFVQHLRPAGDKSIHLHFGAAFATGIEVARKWFFGSEPLSAESAVEAGIEAATQEYGFMDAQGTYKTLDRLVGALRYYFQTWPLDEEVIRPLNEGIECAFSIPLPVLNPDTGKMLNYVGRYDMRGIDDQHRIWIVDEKTASKLGDLWDAKWDLDCQLTGYIWSVQQQFRRGELTLPPEAGPVPDIRALVRAVSILKYDYGHSEVPMVRSAWYIDRWYGQLVRDVQRMVESYKLGTWDLALHENACVQFGRKCDFNPLCLTPHPERIIESGMYRLHDWNPTKKGSE